MTDKQTDAIGRLRQGSGNTDVLVLLDAYDTLRVEVERQAAQIIRLFDERDALLAEIERLRTLIIEHHSADVSRTPPGNPCPVCQT
jgi:hypothetical protein